jgi:hypothetical protein
VEKLWPLTVLIAAGLESDKTIADDLNQRIKASGLKNVDAKATGRGVTITAGAPSRRRACQNSRPSL